MKKFQMMILGLASIFVLGIAAPGFSAIVTFELNFEFSGATEPSGTPPWATAIFNDGDSPGSVLLTLNTSGLSGSEFVSEWYFNFNPDKNLESLNIAAAAGNTVTENISIGVDSYKADGAGFFDILFSYPNGPPAARFNKDITLEYTLTMEGLIAADFYAWSTESSKGQFLTAAHIQGIGEDSGWIAGDNGNGGGQLDPIPEPSTVILLGAGLVGLGLWYRRKKA
jgi:hypothetical protein